MELLKCLQRVFNDTATTEIYTTDYSSAASDVYKRQGNVEAKELICMTHGHELRGRNEGGRGDSGQRGIKGRKIWDNYNSIINKVYIKKYKVGQK